MNLRTRIAVPTLEHTGVLSALRALRVRLGGGGSCRTSGCVPSMPQWPVVAQSPAKPLFALAL